MGFKKVLGLAASVALLFASLANAQSDPRSAYSYVREVSGQVTVVSEANGTVDARRNLPISAGDSLSTEDPARAEIALADGNVLQVGGGTEIRFVSLNGQQGSDDEVTAIDLSSGSVILSAVGSDDQSVPRIDTEDATVYASLGSRVRVNADLRRGSAVIVRAGSVEVRTRAGSYTVRAGNYLTANGEEDPEIARGEFSRDRFDAWAADRLEIASESTRSESGRYVGEDYAGDVQALDGYGDWDYNTTYDTNVWRPNVGAGWSPYSYGSWYYTPVGLSWWSWDPWGWYPFHYGNWFFDAGWNSWCWSPGYVYSPAWVYWGYSGNYLGWCPVGYYGYYSPWWDTYYKQWSYPRADCFAINGQFSTRRVDLRGWNFTGANNVGARGRVEVVSGTRAVDRLGSNLAISSRPLVVPARSGNVRDALREQIREAPRTIERTAGRDSERLAPVVAREARLPASSVDALRDRAVIAERGRLSGPGAPDVAPRGATIVERPDSARGATVRRDDRSGRTVITNRGSQASPERGRTAPAPERGGGTQATRPQPRSETADTWRTQPRSASPRAEASPREESVQRGGQSWRSRPEVPPARRVIEGAVPGRRATESPKASESWRQSPRRESAPRDVSPREASPREAAPREAAPRSRDSAPPRRDSAPPPSRDSSPRERPQSPPSYRSAPPPRESAPRQAPPPRDSAPRQAPAPPPSYRSAPPPRDSAPRSAPAPAPRSIERAPAPSRQAPQYSAPSRPAPQSSAPRSAPAPNGGRPGRN